MATDLYSTTDVAKVRSLLLTEQDGCDKLTGLPIPQGQAVCDHSHKTQYVRGVLHRQSNAVLGKIENLWTRYLSYWYNGTLAQFLRQAANYLELKEEDRYVHPAWIKRVTIDFGKLKAEQQSNVLTKMQIAHSGNSASRKLHFTKALKTKQFTFEQIKEYLNDANLGHL